LAADIPDANLTADPTGGDSVLRVEPAQLELTQLRAIHTDDEDAEAATQRAKECIDDADLGDEDAELALGDCEDNLMSWYDSKELGVLVNLMWRGGGYGHSSASQSPRAPPMRQRARACSFYGLTWAIPSRKEAPTRCCCAARSAGGAPRRPGARRRPPGCRARTPDPLVGRGACSRGDSPARLPGGRRRPAPRCPGPRGPARSCGCRGCR